MKNCTQIEMNEWFCCGHIIQKQNYHALPLFISRPCEGIDTVNIHQGFRSAVKWCNKNPIETNITAKDYL
jgi:hypothetical protein